MAAALLDFIQHFLFTPDKETVLVVGLEGAGKRTILKNKKLGLNDVTTSFLTPDWEVTTATYRHIELVSFDITKDSLPPWEQVYPIVKGIIFVVDSSEPSALPRAKVALHSLLVSHSSLSNAVLLVLSNNCAPPRAVDSPTLGASLSSLAEGLRLKDLMEWKWTLLPCDGKTGYGLETGMAWMGDMLDSARTFVPNAVE